MPVFDDIKEQTLKMKDMTWKQRLQYFWGYYKIHTLVIIAAIIMLVWIIHDMTHQANTALYALLLNAGGYNMPENAGEGFAEYAGIDSDESEVFIDATMLFNPDDLSQNSYYSSMKIAALFAAGEVDAFVCSDALFHHYGLTEAFLELEEVMTPQQIESYGLDLFYIDRAEIAARDAEQADLFAEQIEPVLPDESEVDYRDPSQMEDPVAIGFYLNVADVPFFTENRCYLGADEVVYGFIGNSTKVQTAVQFLDYLTERPKS